ncbi:MAG TPA: alanine racemase [Firmicutes bacterium]|nr:alanine racemase [Bacillota bacterium]
MHGFPLRPAWAEIDLRAVAHNVRQFRALIPAETKLLAIVKANAYGHGAVPVARAAVAAGADWLGVGMLEEAAELRDHGLDVPILILGFTPAYYAPYLLEYKVTPSLFTPEEALAFSEAAVRAGRTMDVHVKVDTGMTRVGCYPAESAADFVAFAAALPGLRVTGLYTHFAAADSHDLTFARRQLQCFLDLSANLQAQGIRIPLRHAANSAGVINFPEAALDMVRIGIGLYGLFPSAETRQDVVRLQPVMSLKAKLIYVKEVPAGTGISYGSTYVTEKPSRIATLNIGYGDGYNRRLSNRGQVLVRGRRAPVVGRICMDQTMICVDGITGVKTGDTALLFGRDQAAELHVDEVAGWLDTINYEVVTAVSRRVPRVYLGEDDN